MIRRLFTLASALSLLLLLGTVVLWVRSCLAAGDWWGFTPTVLVESIGGAINLITSTRPQVYVPEERDLNEFRAGASSRWHLAGVEYYRYGPSYDPIVWTVVRIPYWLAALATAALPATTMLKLWRRNASRGKGRCKRCGYDLRATPDRCPECGTPVGDGPGAADIGTLPRRSKLRTGMAAAGLAMFLAVVVMIRHESTLPAPSPTASTTPTPLIDPEYVRKVNKITSLFEDAPTSRPSKQDAEELFDLVAHDPDFRVRARAMAVLPFVEDRERAIDTLIAAVHEHDSRTNGGGNVPLYATTYLADMKAARAIPDITDWLRFLENDQSFDQQLKPGVLRKIREDLARLKAVETQPTETENRQ